MTSTPHAASPIDVLADHLLALTLAAEPLDATLMGFRQHDSDLADLSLEAEAARAAARAALRIEVLAVDPVGLSEQDAITRAVLLASLAYSDDAMTADWARLPQDLLARISTRIINEVRGINRVVYDISSKPPSTIEWE